MSAAEPPAAGTQAPDAAAVRPEVPPWRLVATLAVAGVLAGLLLVFVDQATRDVIEAHRREALAAAVDEVLGDPARVVSLRVEDGRLVPEDELTWAVDTERLDRVFLGYADEAGEEPLGFAVAYERSGFQDAVRVIFGYDPRTRRLLGMRVLEHKETPGLGDKIEQEAFVTQFEGALAPLEPVKPGEGDGGPNEVDTVTGATISSKTVVEVIDAALARLESAFAAWAEEEAP